MALHQAMLSRVCLEQIPNVMAVSMTRKTYSVSKKSQITVIVHLMLVSDE